MAPDRPRNALRAVLPVCLALGLLSAAVPVATVVAQEPAPSFAKLDKPFGSFDLMPVVDTTGLVDGAGFPFTGAIEGIDGADITLSAAGVVKLNKKQANQAKSSWNKAKQKAGAGGGLKAGRYLASVIETVGPPSGDVAFYGLLDGPKANDLVAGYPLDPRNGSQLSMLFGVLGGNIATGDTNVAGQAISDQIQFYNIANQTAVWRKGNRWYVLRPLPKGATMVDIRSALTAGSQQVFDMAGGAPTVLSGPSFAGGVRCFNAFGTPAAALDGGPATSNFLQLNLVLDGDATEDLDPAGLMLQSVDGGTDPIPAEVYAFDEYGSALVNFSGVPNGRHRLIASTFGAEPIVGLLPGVLHFDGVAAGVLRGGVACNSTIEGLYANGFDACSFGDPAALGTVLGVDPSAIMPFRAPAPDGSQTCAWGAPGVFAGTTFGVRLVTDLDLVRESLAECTQTDLQGEIQSFVAVCPGLVQHVQLTPADAPGLDGAGFPSGTAFLLGQNPAVDAYFAQVTEALAGGDVTTAAELIDAVLAGDALGYAGMAAAQLGYLGQ